MPAAWKTARNGVPVAAMSATTRVRASRSAASQATTVASAPNSASSWISSVAPGAAEPRLLVSTILSTPWPARCRARCAPTAPVPPVISAGPRGGSGRPSGVASNG